ncbi:MULTISPECIES: DUF3310 domain-containing protein [unclassified Aminobacter]|uniref:DUF3310 domain-containing protein n=1 Tax=unclassified Aminobacter TaxID=2644704 RepID=UPI000466A5F7|nr:MULTISPECIES: DUF3310 domain-containing protein [unclassified Aminobacter]TWH35579.1 uncharacterized protein DUF3310 [Aminobacter sp. J15]
MQTCTYCGALTAFPCDTVHEADCCSLARNRGEEPKEEPKSALKSQVGGDHYKKLKIQPMEYSMANGLDACQHTAIKYITRFRDKGTPLQDLEKAIHAIELLIEFEGLRKNEG